MNDEKPASEHATTDLPLQAQLDSALALVVEVGGLAVADDRADVLLGQPPVGQV